ncbi:hypothetical protein Tco_0566170 [Tanacetum coccineum]
MADLRHGMTQSNWPNENVDYQISKRLCNLSFLEYLKLYFFKYEHVAVNSTRHGLDTATIGKPVEFKRISLIGFRSCTSRSRYQSVSKQRTRCHKFDSYRIAQVTCRSACLMLALVEFKRISLTGFRSCTSRSHYRSISKQVNTRKSDQLTQVRFILDSQVPTKSCLMLAQMDFYLHYEYKEYRSDVSRQFSQG